MNMSQHARVRSQQRAIPRILIDLLLDFGAREPAGNGACKIFLDKAARRQVNAYVGPLAELFNEYLDIYIVVSSNGHIITIAHRTTHIRRN